MVILKLQSASRENRKNINSENGGKPVIFGCRAVGVMHPVKEFKSLSWVFERLVNSRQWGGNFLCNVGPRPDGQMPGNYYKYCQSLSEWMKVNRESVIGTDPVPESLESNVPCTAHENIVYAHLLKKQANSIILKNVDKPKAVAWLHDHTPIVFIYDNKTTVYSFEKFYLFRLRSGYQDRNVMFYYFPKGSL